MLVEIVGALWELEKFNGTESNNSPNNLSPAAIGVVVGGVLCTIGVICCMMSKCYLRLQPSSNRGYANEHQHSSSSSASATNTLQDESMEMTGAEYNLLQDSDQT